MSPPNAERRPPTRDAATHTITAATKPQDRDDRTAAAQIPVAYATRVLAAGDATLDWVLVRRCPLCGHGHRHILYERDAAAVERAPSCARHRVYRLEIVDVLPAAADRERGAA